MARRPIALVVVAAIAAVLVFACAIDNLNLSSKECPCLSGYQCDLPTNRCVLARSDGGTPGQDSSTSGDGATEAGELFAEDLVGYWALDEDGGSVALDSSGRGNAGVLRNAPARVPGRFGGALSFDGVNQSLDVFSLNAANFPRSGTLAIWFKLDSAAKENRSLFDERDQARKHLSIRQYNGGLPTVPTLQIAGEGADGGYAFVSIVNVEASTWHHLVVVWDLESHTQRVYLDNLLTHMDTIEAAWDPSEERVSFAACCGGFKGSSTSYASTNAPFRQSRFC